MSLLDKIRIKQTRIGKWKIVLQGLLLKVTDTREEAEEWVEKHYGDK